MKRWTLVVIGLGALVALGVCVNHARTSSREAAADSAPAEYGPIPKEPRRVETVAKTRRTLPIQTADRNAMESEPFVAPRLPSPSPIAVGADSEPNCEQIIETVTSPRTTYKQRQAAWKQLKNSNDLARVTRELEQRVTDNPQSADYAVALGQAYWKRCSDSEDMRDQAILAMKADQEFETALKLDPANWEARFTKTVGMSYWPAELNKGREVIEQFQALIQQQEAQAPQPQFAKSYLRLGDVYLKAGYPDYANQVWQRGAAMFPDNSDLKEKLSATP